jgi:hypothetical protein
LPNSSVLLCGPALDAKESAASLDILRQVTLPSAAKFVVTTGKFDAGGAAKTVNVDADYPPDPAYLLTLLRWAEISELADPRFRDGYDLYCLRRILARFKTFDYAVVLREGADRLQERWPDLQRGVGGRLFLTLEKRSPADHMMSTGPSIVIDLKDDRTPAFLEAVSELYRTGAVYGMEAYTLEGALSAALDVIELQQVFRQPQAPNSGDPSPLPDSQGVMDGRLLDCQTD